MKDDMKYDEFGNLDTEYYLEKAYQMRRIYCAAVMKKALTSVKTFVVNLTTGRALKSPQSL